MSEAAGRAELENGLLRSSLEDDAFRQRPLSDPKAAVEEEFGTPLPGEMRVVAAEETADTVYLALPFRPTEEQESGELSDWELEAEAGGRVQPSHSVAFPTEASCGC